MKSVYTTDHEKNFCSCPAYRFQKAPAFLRTCKHLSSTKKHLKPVPDPPPAINVSSSVPTALPESMLVSTKLDGLHVCVRDGVMYTTKGYIIDFVKVPFVNEHAVEGELVCNPYFSNTGKRTTWRDVMNKLAAKKAHDLKFYAFDCDLSTDSTFTQRYQWMQSNIPTENLIPQTNVHKDDVRSILQRHLQLGHEGIVCRNPSSVYSIKRCNRKVFKMKKL